MLKERRIFTGLGVAAAVGLAALTGGRPAETHGVIANHIEDIYGQCGGTTGLEDFPRGVVFEVARIHESRTGRIFWAQRQTDQNCAAPASQETRVLPNWPNTPGEAATTFGVDDRSRDPNRWRRNPDGGWNFSSGDLASAVNPRGYVAEGYRDTSPGTNADCFVSAGVEVGMQGGTVWSVTGETEARSLLQRVPAARWTDGSLHPCRAVGF